MTPEPVKALAELRANAVIPDEYPDYYLVRRVDYDAVFSTGADPAALLSPRVDVERLAKAHHETCCALGRGSDPRKPGPGVAFHSCKFRDAHRKSMVAFAAAYERLNRDTGSAEPEPEYTYDASCPHCRAGTPHHPIEAATEPTPETKEGNPNVR